MLPTTQMSSRPSSSRASGAILMRCYNHGTIVSCSQHAGWILLTCLDCYRKRFEAMQRHRKAEQVAAVAATPARKLKLVSASRNLDIESNAADTAKKC
jgi:hypothetical protein